MADYDLRTPIVSEDGRHYLIREYYFNKDSGLIDYRYHKIERRQWWQWWI